MCSIKNPTDVPCHSTHLLLLLTLPSMFLDAASSTLSHVETLRCHLPSLPLPQAIYCASVGLPTKTVQHWCTVLALVNSFETSRREAKRLL